MNFIDDDLVLFISDVIPNIYYLFNKKIKKFFNYDCSDIESVYFDLVFNRYLCYVNGLKKSMDIVFSKKIMYDNLDNCFEAMINFSDDELEIFIANFLYKFYSMVNDICINFFDVIEENYGLIIMSSKFFNDDYFYFIKSMINDISVLKKRKNADLIRIIKKYFKKYANSISNINEYCSFVFYKLLYLVLLERVKLLYGDGFRIPSTEEVLKEIYEYYATVYFDDYKRSFDLVDYNDEYNAEWGYYNEEEEK